MEIIGCGLTGVLNRLREARAPVLVAAVSSADLGKAAALALASTPEARRKQAAGPRQDERVG
jgi:hypothetical protein